MKKILIPTDFSDNAWDALMYAVRLYDDIRCTFFILNTFQSSPSNVTNMMRKKRDTPIFQYVKTNSEKELQKIAHHLNNHLLNDLHAYKTLSVTGPLITIMKQVVAAENIDLIVMGTAGATGAKEIFLGSNTVKAMKHIDLCPIISVPKDYVFQEPEQVIFATDFKRHFNSIEFENLLELQSIYNFNITVLHIQAESALDVIQQQNKKALQHFFDKKNVVFEEIKFDTSVAKAITSYVKKHEVDMICLLNYEHSFMESLLHEPILKKISFHSAVPLLIVQV